VTFVVIWRYTLCMELLSLRVCSLFFLTVEAVRKTGCTHAEIKVPYTAYNAI